jgi:hypothetical protein
MDVAIHIGILKVEFGNIHKAIKNYASLLEQFGIMIIKHFQTIIPITQIINAAVKHQQKQHLPNNLDNRAQLLLNAPILDVAIHIGIQLEIILGENQKAI